MTLIDFSKDIHKDTFVALEFVIVFVGQLLELILWDQFFVVDNQSLVGAIMFQGPILYGTYMAIID